MCFAFLLYYKSKTLFMSTTIPNLAQRQVMLSFAYMAYCGEQITTPSPEATILGYINTAMPQITPIAAPNDLWAVVWGPAVYTVPGALYQDNMMYVVQNQTDTTQYAIAIRGTNFVSGLDWLLEDFDVLQQMNWPPGAATPNPAGAMMSESTSIDLQILLAMQGTVIATGAQSSLMSYLQSQTKNAINLCVTGHSLGGCLAGTLALYLKETQATWDASGSSNVSCITFAAPTAGNAAFAAYSDSMFAGGPYPPNWDSTLGTTFDAVRCNYDVAPQAWIAANVSQGSGTNASSPLFETYGSNLDFATGLSFLSGAAWNYIVQNFLPPVAGFIAPQNYQQPESGAAQLAGTFNTALAPADDSLTTYLQAFVAQGAWQHGNSYPTILGVTSLLNSNIIVKG
jgi:Lipase (class 3)